MLTFQKFKRFMFKYNLIPTKKWRMPATLLMGVIIGLGLYLIRLSNASAYLSDDPQACVNCHIMTPQYLTWTHSSHREVAHCNDCHVPHDNVFNKYYFKAKDGLNHAAKFTLRAEPEVIRAVDASIKVIQNNCVRCHLDQVTDAKMASMVNKHTENRTSRLCWDCHKEVPHGKVKSLSAVGHQIEPIEAHKTASEMVVPTWLQSEIDKTKNK